MRVSDRPNDDALLDIDFVDAALPWRSGCLWLGGARREIWVSPGGVEVRPVEHGVWYRLAAGLSVVGLHQALPLGEDAAVPTDAAYRRLLATVRPSAHPYPTPSPRIRAASSRTPASLRSALSTRSASP